MNRFASFAKQTWMTHGSVFLSVKGSTFPSSLFRYERVCVKLSVAINIAWVMFELDAKEILWMTNLKWQHTFFESGNFLSACRKNYFLSPKKKRDWAMAYPLIYLSITLVSNPSFPIPKSSFAQTIQRQLVKRIPWFCCELPGHVGKLFRGIWCRSERLRVSDCFFLGNGPSHKNKDFRLTISSL